MIEIIPAIMPESYEDLREKAERVAGSVRVVQIDVMDGVFVPAQSWPHNKHPVRHDPEEGEDGDTLPCVDRVAYEIDLMVAEPRECVPFWIRPGVRRLIIHLESGNGLGALIVGIRDRHEHVDFADVGPFEIGIAIGTETPLSAVTPFLRIVDFVQCMGIAEIGYQGQPFDERAIERIRDLRTAHPEVIISVDGGVSLDTAPRLVAAGANRLVSGSAIFESMDAAAAIAALKQAAEHGGRQDADA